MDKKDKIPESIKKTGYFILKLAVITSVVIILMWTVVKPVILNQINPGLKLVVQESMKEQMDFINYYVSEDIVRMIEKQYTKIKKGHENIYPKDVENAIKYYDLLLKKLPDKITPGLEEWVVVIKKWYRGEISKGV